MKTARKVLSVFLSVLMIMSCLTVSFSVFAADDPYKILADALKNENVSKGSYSYNFKSTVTAEDPTGDITKAANAFWAVAKNVFTYNTSPDFNGDNPYSAVGVAKKVKNELQNRGYMTSSEMNQYSVSMVIDYFVGNVTTNYVSGSSTSRTCSFKVHTSAASLVLQYDKVSDIPDTLYLTTTFSFSESVGKLWGMKFWYTNQNGMSVSQAAPDTSTKSQLTAFGNYFTESLLSTDAGSLSTEELNAMIQANQKAIDACSLWSNDTVMNHFFDKERIQTFVDTVKSLRDKPAAVACANKLIANMQNDLSSLSYEELKTQKSETEALRTEFNNYATAAKEAALAETGLNMSDVALYLVRVNEEIEVRELTDIKADVDALIADTDTATVSDDALSKALSVAKEKLKLINKRSEAARNRVFPEGTGYIQDFIDAVSEEMQVRKLNKEISVYYEYFDADRLATDFDALSAETIIKDYRDPDTEKLKDLQNKYSEEAIVRVFGEKYEQVKAYVANFDPMLENRLKTQIDTVYNEYEDGGREVNIFNHKIMRDTIEGIEQILLDEYPLDGEYKEKYEMFGKIREQCIAFDETYGLSNWTHDQSITYPQRGLINGDIARTEEEIYFTDEEKVSAAIAAIDNLMTSEKFADLIGLEKLIPELLSDTLYTDETVNSLLKTIYPALINLLDNIDLSGAVISGTMTAQDLADALGGLSKVISILGIHLYPEDVANYLNDKDYPEAKAALRSCQNDWEQFDDVTWGVTDKASFIRALSNGLSGLQKVFGLLFTDKPFMAFGLVNVNIAGMKLYQDSLLPLFELLGCENLMSADDYNGSAYNAETYLTPILTPLFDFLETVVNNPMTAITDILPKLAYVMDFDMISEHIKLVNLTGSVKVTAFGANVNIDLAQFLTDNVGSNNLYEILKSVATNFDMRMLSDINLLLDFVLDQVAPDSNLVLPTINQSKLASLGSLAKATSLRKSGERIEYTSNKPVVFVTVLRFLLPLVGDADFVNAVLALVSSLTGSEIVLSEDISALLTRLGENPDHVISALCEVVTPQEYAIQPLTYAYAEEAAANGSYTVSRVTYSDQWTKSKAQYVADNLSDYINSIMTLLTGSDFDSFIETALAGLFTNQTVSKLVILLRDLLPEKVYTVANVDTTLWNQVDESYDWGFADGDPEGFKHALITALQPLTPVLNATLADKDLDLLDAGTVNGYDGYRTGIIPLLENIGCDSDDILTYEEYVLAVESDETGYAGLDAILTPVCNLLAKISSDPVNTVAAILPNILYFMSGDNLQICVENAAHGVFVVFDTIRPVYDVRINLNLDLTQLVLDAIAGLEINGEPANLNIPFTTIMTALQVGTVSAYPSKSGETAYHVANGTNADFLTVILRSVLEMMFYKDNIDLITKLLAEKAGMSEANEQTLNAILNQFASMYHEVHGVDMILNAFYHMFRGTKIGIDETMDGVGTFNKYWNTVFEELYNCGDEDLKRFAERVAEAVEEISLGLVTDKGIGANGLLAFFNALKEFFKRIIEFFKNLA